MPARLRSKSEIEQDRALETELFLKGWTQRAIAERIGVTETQVRYDLRKVQEEWRTKAVYDWDLLRQQELRRIDLLEAEAWAAWEKSKAPREITTTRTSKKTLAPVEMTATTNAASKRNEQRDPDARYMAVIQWCISERAKLLGLYAPTEMRLTAGTKAVSEVVYELPPDGPTDGLMVIGGAPRLPAPEGENGLVEYAEVDNDQDEIVIEQGAADANGEDQP